MFHSFFLFFMHFLPHFIFQSESKSHQKSKHGAVHYTALPHANQKRLNIPNFHTPDSESISLLKGQFPPLATAERSYSL